MEFGKVSNVDEVDFKMPHDPAMNKKVLGGKPFAHPHIYVGCAKWGRPDWVGTLYPKGTKAADYLKHYTKHYNSIELNAMFYQLFPKATVAKWASYADDDFRFSPKFTQAITHFKRLKDAERETDDFLDTMQSFGNKLGTSFIQMGDNFGPKNFGTLQSYIEALPKDFDVALELRHTDWYNDKTVATELFHLLQANNTASIITDTSGRRDLLHMHLPTKTAFIRWVGNNLHPTDFKRLDDWTKRIKLWLGEGLETLYFYVHNHEEANTPQLSDYFIKKLNKECGLNITPPHLIKTNETLF
jgi:uncharacterized protein YecE (DUF72 family)